MSTEQWAMDDTQRTQEPATELGLYKEVKDPSTKDSFLRSHNLGLGKYSNKEYWQQIDAFKSHMFSDAAFSSSISSLAIYQTQWALGEDYMENTDGDDPCEKLRELELIDESEPIGHRQAIALLGQYRWEMLGALNTPKEDWEAYDDAQKQERTRQEQYEELQKRVGTSANWMTPHSRMVSARHEASRSRGAHLLDNLFNRVQEHRQEQPSNASSNGDGGWF